MTQRRKYRELVRGLALNDYAAVATGLSVQKIRRLTDEALGLMLPQPPCRGKYSPHSLAARAGKIHRLLSRQISLVSGRSPMDAEREAWEFLSSLPTLKSALLADADAIYCGDPAAASAEEVIICYPGFFATAVYRLAHLLYSRKIPYIPRIMTEYAHEKTGIDIHPGATIGEGLCIDHGTGVVIGETAVIGDNVRIYQGVTLGARSLEEKGDGGSLRGAKRHPQIGNNCIIYAGATILGGDTVIGDGCVIGGNVWLTHSVPSGQTVYYKK